MLQIIISLSLLIIAVTIFVTYYTSGSTAGKYIIGVQLPPGVRKRTEVMELTSRFRHGNVRMFLLFLIFALPLLRMIYISLILLYMSVWCIAYFYIANRYFQKYFIKLLRMKSDNLWFSNETDYHILGPIKDKSIKPFFKFWDLLFPSVRERLLKNAASPIYVDEDEYWLEGYYDNPYDRRKSVDKRVGFGSTYNMAHRAGKIINAIAVIFVVVLIGGLSVLFYQMEFSTFQMEIKENTVRIHAPIYQEQFEVNDIQEVALTDTLPQDGVRTNGAATDTYYLGNFKLEGYGRSKVFVYIGYPPYLVVTLKDRTVIFNSKSEAETKEYYRQLINLIEKQ